MYERFTDRARKVMQLANQEAQRFNHEYIGTEHILLGMCKEGTGVASTVLNNLNCVLLDIQMEVEKIVKPGPDMVIMGRLPQSTRAQKAIEYAMEESRDFNHNYVGTEHLLLGLIRERDGIAGKLLHTLGLTAEAVRQSIVELLGSGKPPVPSRESDTSRMEAFSAMTATEVQICQSLVNAYKMFQSVNPQPQILREFRAAVEASHATVGKHVVARCYPEVWSHDVP